MCHQHSFTVNIQDVKFGDNGADGGIKCRGNAQVPTQSRTFLACGGIHSEEVLIELIVMAPSTFIPVPQMSI